MAVTRSGSFLFKPNYEQRCQSLTASYRDDEAFDGQYARNHNATTMWFLHEGFPLVDGIGSNPATELKTQKRETRLGQALMMKSFRNDLGTQLTLPHN